jgi:membrane protease YdiL (CAAX protease family)
VTRVRTVALDVFPVAVGVGILAFLPPIGFDAGGSAIFAGLLALAVVIPWLLARFVTRRTSVSFAWSDGWPWSRKQWWWLAAVPLAGCLVLAPYLIGLRGHEYWPPVEGIGAAIMLAVGIFALGLWEELFFVGVVANSLRRHLPAWGTVAVRVAIAVPLLWSWGFQGIGPWIIATFSVFQGLLWERTRSLSYVIAVHLAFDVALIVTLLWARYPGWLDAAGS